MQTAIDHNTTVPPTYRKASFWKRLGAYVIDYLILAMFFVGYAFVCGATDLLVKIELIFAVIYYVYSIVRDYYFQGSIGKKIFRLRVISIYKRRPTFVNSFYRNIGKIVSSLVFGYGYIRILAPHRYQTIHDELGRCFVVEVDK